MSPKTVETKIDALSREIEKLEAKLDRKYAKQSILLATRHDVMDSPITPEQSAKHKQMRSKLLPYFLNLPLRVHLTSPFVYGMVIPFAILDLSVIVFQAICFWAWKIPKIRRRDHVVLDRHHLAYLNGIEKLNCIFCGYANGVINFTRQVAGRTEEYWCPIKHAARIHDAHAKYREFVAFGDVQVWEIKIQISQFLAIDNSTDMANPTSQRTALTPYDYVLYAITVLSWSGSWYALKLQVGVVPVQVSLFWRFLLAASIMLVWALIARVPLPFFFWRSFEIHRHGRLHVLLEFLTVLLRFNLDRLRAVIRGIFAGVSIKHNSGSNIPEFAPNSKHDHRRNSWRNRHRHDVLAVIAGQDFDTNALFGLGLCIVGTLFFCTGNLISSNLQNAKIPIVSASTWGMAYGAVVTALIALLRGDSFAIIWSVRIFGLAGFF